MREPRLNPNKVLAGIAATFAAALIAVPYGYRKYEERNWPEAVKNTEIRHAFSSEGGIRSAVNQVWSEYRPDELRKGDCSGRYMFIERTTKDHGATHDFRLFVGVFKDGQPDTTEAGQSPANNTAHIAQVTSLTPEARAIYQHAYNTYFQAEKIYDDAHTYVVPLGYDDLPKAQAGSRTVSFVLPELGMSMTFDRGQKPTVTDLAVGGVYSGSYTFYSGTAEPTPILQAQATPRP